MNVFISGAAGGLGRAMAAECARRGWRLFLTDRNASGLETLQRGLERQFGITVAVRACDLTDPRDVDGMLSVMDRCGLRFDMMLNIAGVDFEGGFTCRDRESLVKIVAVNDEATVRVTHAILARRREGRPFTAVFVSSLASMFPMPLKATYAASKGFLLNFALALRQELKGEGANALVLCPGGMMTREETQTAIRAQGFWGGLTTNPLERVARRTLDRALAGKGLYIPGGVNKLLSCLGKLLPRSWAAAAIYGRWDRAQKKWLHV